MTDSATLTAGNPEVTIALEEIADKRGEFSSYARALTEYLQPFSFPKPDCFLWPENTKLRVLDDGQQPYYNGSAEYRAGMTRSHIGTLDYWSAAVIDPDFMKLCRQRMVAQDIVGGTIDVTDHVLWMRGLRDRKAMKDMMSLYSSEAPPQLETKSGDGWRGWRKRTEVYSGTDAEIGAMRRLDDELVSRYIDMARDPQKAEAMGRVRAYFRDTFAEVAAQVTTQTQRFNQLKYGMATPQVRDQDYDPYHGFEPWHPNEKQRAFIDRFVQGLPKITPT